MALTFLKKEFPNLKFVTLPAYHLKYARNSKWNIIYLIIQSPKVLWAVIKEYFQVKRLVKTGKIDGIISDNRFGVFSKKIPSVYITHQIQVLSGITTKITTKIHQFIIKKYDECWVPDNELSRNLTGKLSHTRHQIESLKFIGSLSSFKNVESKKDIDVLILLSGLEPQRTQLELKLMQEFNNCKMNLVLIRGTNKKRNLKDTSNIKIFDLVTSKKVNELVSKSKLVIARSGYSTIMDLSKVNAPVFFIPTPYQKEQEYLAEFLNKSYQIPFARQDDFKLSLIEENEVINWPIVNRKPLLKLFNLFEGK